MTRSYRQTIRAGSERATRDRILDAAMQTLQTSRRLQIRDVASAGSVTVQTVYSHFGSKGGLVTAMIDRVSMEQGLLKKLAAIRSLEDGVSGLKAQVNTTFGFWHTAWPFIKLLLDLRRVDSDFADQIAKLDVSRLADLVSVTEQMRRESTLRNGLQPKEAAALAFSLTTPYVYEELVASGRLSYAAALRLVRDVAVAAIIQR